MIYYTDGSCLPNPGEGGHAVIRDGKLVASGRKKLTTNNQMEGMAILEALKDAAGEPCKIYTDSQLWVNILTKWASGWKKKGWRKQGDPIKNLELVKVCYEHFENSNAKILWVKGHSGDEGNKQADKYANLAREGKIKSFQFQ